MATGVSVLCRGAVTAGCNVDVVRLALLACWRMISMPAASAVT